MEYISRAFLRVYASRIKTKKKNADRQLFIILRKGVINSMKYLLEIKDFICSYYIISRKTENDLHKKPFIADTYPPKTHGYEILIRV